MSLLSKNLKAQAPFQLQSLEQIENQQGYGVLDNATGTVLHVRLIHTFNIRTFPIFQSEGTFKTQPELLEHFLFMLQDVQGLLSSSSLEQNFRKLQIKFDTCTYHVSASSSSTFVVMVSN